MASFTHYWSCGTCAGAASKEEGKAFSELLARAGEPA